MSLTINTLIDDSIDHETDIKSLLVSQYCDSKNFLDMLLAISKIKQEIEEVSLDLLDKRTLANSEGVQLDGLGELVGLSRDGRNDADYKDDILAQIQINLSGGQTEILIQVIQALTGATIIQVDDSYPARVTASFNGIASSNLSSVLNRLKAAGVELALVQFSSNPFVFEGDTGGSGFSDEDFLNGGELSEVI